MTSTALIIFCLAFFITGSTAFWDIFGRDETARRHAYEKLNDDIRVIRGHYIRLSRQVVPARNQYNLVWSGVFAPVTKEIQDVRTKVSNALNPLNRNRLYVNGECHNIAQNVSKYLTFLQENVYRCWTDSETRVNEIAKILTDLYEQETQYLENYKSDVDTMHYYELIPKKRIFAVRRKIKIGELTTAKNNLVSKINKESGDLSKCVRENQEYVDFKPNQAKFAEIIESCVQQKLNSPLPEESSDATLSPIAYTTNKPSTNPEDHIELYTISADYDDR